MYSFSEAVEISRLERRQRESLDYPSSVFFGRLVASRRARGTPTPEALANISYSALLNLSLSVASDILSTSAEGRIEVTGITMNHENVSPRSL